MSKASGIWEPNRFPLQPAARNPAYHHALSRIVGDWAVIGVPVPIILNAYTRTGPNATFGGLDAEGLTPSVMSLKIVSMAEALLNARREGIIVGPSVVFL